VPAEPLAVFLGLVVLPVLELLQAATLSIVTAATSAADTRAPSVLLGIFT
jgi:hypothetical protein